MVTALLYVLTLALGILLGMLMQHLLPSSRWHTAIASRFPHLRPAAIAASAARWVVRVHPALAARLGAWAPQHVPDDSITAQDSHTLSVAQHDTSIPTAPEQPAAEERPPWHIGEDEAVALVSRMMELDAGREAGWKHMMDKEQKGVYSYTAHKRPLPGVKRTEYCTVTTVCGASPRDCMEFLLDDDARRGWEGFLVGADILEAGDWVGGREEVVRWVRRFPFHFLTDREYIMARKAWADMGGGALGPLSAARPGAALYAVTRGLDDHPGADHSGALVRTASFSSCWRCHAVADPFGGPGPATSITLLHSEDIKIPEYLARTAVAVGMSKFVGEMAGGLARFVRARRARGLGPDAPDPLAYGHDFAARCPTPQHGHGHLMGRAHSQGMGAVIAGGARHGSMRPADDEVLDAGADYGPHACEARSSGEGAVPDKAGGSRKRWLLGGRGGGSQEAPVSAREALHLHPRRRHHARHHTSPAPQSAQHQAAGARTSATAALTGNSTEGAVAATAAAVAAAAAVQAAAGARLVLERGSKQVVLSSPALAGGPRAVRRLLPGAAPDAARADQEAGVKGGKGEERGVRLDDVGMGAADVGPHAAHTWANAAAAAAAAALHAGSAVTKLGAASWPDAPADAPALPSSPQPSWGSVSGDNVGGAAGAAPVAGAGAGVGAMGRMGAGGKKGAGWTQRRVVRLAMAGALLVAGRFLARAAAGRGAQGGAGPSTSGGTAEAGGGEEGSEGSVSYEEEADMGRGADVAEVEC